MARNRIDTLISDCKSWSDFVALANAQENEKDKGDLFERLTQLYLQVFPTYRTKFKNVWWLNNGELPRKDLRKLGLPERDEGIDLVCKTYDGEYFSIQCKYTSIDRALTSGELATFVRTSFVVSDKIDYGLVVHNSTSAVRKKELMGKTSEIGLQDWLSISEDLWTQIIDLCVKDKLKKPKKRLPLKHQKRAIRDASRYFVDENKSRGKLIMPCGTGKSLTAFWIAETLKAKTVIIAVPSLALIKQSLQDWTTEFLAKDIRPEWIAICSDDSVGNMNAMDSTVSSVYETGIKTSTNEKEIIEFLNRKTKLPKIIFVTYQSSPVLCKASKRSKIIFDLLISDEAHKTVGDKSRVFSTLLFDKNIKVKQRLFMTATERVYIGDSDDVVSMSDQKIYGDVFHQLTFKRAIDENIICDYRILTLAISDREIKTKFSKNAKTLVKSKKKYLETEMHNLGVGIATEKTFKRYKLNHAISFHRSIERAKQFSSQQQKLESATKTGIEYGHISGAFSAGKRAKILKDFVKSKKSVVSNARCLTEGIDIPTLDSVVFADPKQSMVDIVQATGRALRKSKDNNKKFGYVLIPVVVPEGQTLASFVGSSQYKEVIKCVKALSTQDERIKDEFKDIYEKKERSLSDSIFIPDREFQELFKVSYKQIFHKLSLKTWESLGKSNWLPFEDARHFVQLLNLKNQDEWREYCSSYARPPDIPSAPNTVYLKEWKSFGDWLGTNAVANKYQVFMSFSKARAFVRKLQLKSVADWREYRITNLPSDIPANPERTYANKGWKGYADFLGTGNKSGQQLSEQFYSYEKAREYIIKLNLSSETEWRPYSKSKKRPNFIPASPGNVYKNIGWQGWGHFLGTNRVSNQDLAKQQLDFFTSRLIVRKLKLASNVEWRKYTKSKNFDERLSKDPAGKFKGNGWTNWADFLGTKNIYWGSYVNFSKAKKFARGLNLSSVKDWQKYLKSGQRPSNIPAYPDRAYKNEGWIDWSDYLGSSNVSSNKVHQNYLGYAQAKKYIRSKRFNTVKQLKEFLKSPHKPSNIPLDLRKVYKDRGFVHLNDFISGETMSSGQKGDNFLAYEEAKNAVKRFGLKSSVEWRRWLKFGKRPRNIPAKPRVVYDKKGWVSWQDFLGRK